MMWNVYVRRAYGRGDLFCFVFLQTKHDCFLFKGEKLEKNIKKTGLKQGWGDLRRTFGLTK